MMHPDNVDEVQIFAEEAGAFTVRGLLSYPDEHGGFSVGRRNLEEWLWHFRGREVLLVAAPLGEMALPVLCGLCGSQCEESGCQNCKKEAKEARKFVDWQKNLFEEIEEFLAS